MVTDYFKIYNHKVRLDCIKQQIEHIQKKVDYNKNATVSGGMMARIIKDYCDRVELKLNKRRDAFEAEKAQYIIELLAVNDVQKNIDDSFVDVMLTVLQKNGINARLNRKHGINIKKNVNYITNLFYLYPEEKVVQQISQFIDELYVLENGEQIGLIQTRTTKQIKNMFQDALNYMYAESLNVVAPEYFKDPKHQATEGQLSINSISDGNNL